MITVLTPTYNRGYIITELYNSLKRQTIKKFEWLIIDDGSIDETEKIVSEWIRDNTEFDIKYIKQENGGKHRAWNKGVQYAKGEYIFVVDSDDYLSDDAIEKVCQWIGTIKGEKKFAGVGGLKATKNGNKQLDFLKKKYNQYIDATHIECRKKGLPVDKAEIVRTELMKKYPLPEFENENFISEGAFWQTLIKEGYTFRWYMDEIYFYEYLEDGLTKKNEDNIRKNWNGYTYVTKLSLINEGIYTKIGILLNYINLAKERKINDYDISKLLGMPLIIIKVLKLLGSIYYG